MKIMIIGNWATNKGDRAVLTFMVRQLQKKEEIDKIYVSTTLPNIYTEGLSLGSNVEMVPFGCDLFTMNPVNFVGKVKYRVAYWKYMQHNFPRLIERINMGKRYLKRGDCNKDFWSAIKDSDFLIMTGGHHITTMREYDSIHSLTYELALMYLSGKPYCLWAQTIGPLEIHENKNKKFLYQVLSSASKIYLRDKNSFDTLKKFGYIEQNLYHTYDSVFGMYSLCSKSYVKKRENNTVGISIFYSNIKEDTEEDAYIAEMAEICNYILEKDYNISFFPMETEIKEISIIKRIIEKTHKKDKIMIFDTNVSTEEHVLAVNKCNMYIGHKTHSIIISLVTNTPLIALCYHEKTLEFMKMFEMDKYAINDKEYSRSWFEQKFDELEDRQEEISDKLDKFNRKYSQKVCEDLCAAFENDVRSGIYQ